MAAVKRAAGWDSRASLTFLLRLPLPRQQLRLGDIGWGHALGNNVAVLDSLVAVLRGGSGSSLPSPITSTPWFDEQFSISLKHNDIRGWLVELVRHHILHDFALYVQYRHQFVIELVVKKIDGANSS